MIRYCEEYTETEIGRPFDLEKHDKEISDKWLGKVKQARERIKANSYLAYSMTSQLKVVKLWDVLEILDKLIESEE